MALYMCIWREEYCTGFNSEGEGLRDKVGRSRAGPAPRTSNCLSASSVHFRDRAHVHRNHYSLGQDKETRELYFSEAISILSMIDETFPKAPECVVHGTMHKVPEWHPGPPALQSFME